MTLTQIAILAAVAAVVGRLKTGRSLALLAASTTALFWLQPPEPVTALAFWLPVGTLLLTSICWLITAAGDARATRKNWASASVMAGVVLLLSGVPGFAAWLNPALMAPSWSRGVPLVLAILGVCALLWRWHKPVSGVSVAVAVSILLVFVIVKSPQLTAVALNSLAALPMRMGAATGVPLAWFGYSYIAFRLLHTLRDHHNGRLPSLTLGEYVNFVVFFPAVAAGPIDRAQRFVGDLRAPLRIGTKDWVEIITRLVVGLFKKLVLADLLAVIALNDVLVQYVRRPGWMWVFLYAYALRILLDFSGYTDIAIALGRLLGVRLPENFAAPYLKSNIALFWNSWHISLTQWFRAYVFNPLARWLRRAPRRLPDWSSVLVTQVLTMVLIGIWHGITWNFALWGLWHGIGLFVHNRWSALTAVRQPGIAVSSPLTSALGAAGALATFHFVSFGWLFFGLSTPELTWRAFRLLLGIA